MGTPGDKTKTGEVVIKTEDDCERKYAVIKTEDNSEHEYAAVQLQQYSDHLIFQSDITQNIHTENPQQPSTSTMGVIGRLPQFDTFQALHAVPTIPTPSSEFQLPNLEQAYIDDYFTQTKYYPSISENPLTDKFSIHKESYDQPGPSGLQATKHKTSSSSSSKVKKSKIPRKPYTCTICQKNFVSLEKLNKHQQLHSGQSPFKCEHCKKSFSSKFKLVRHALIHSDRKPFSCTVCERTFHRKDHLKNHIKVHSSSKKVFICEKTNCGKQYTSQMSYKKHLALHAAEEGSLQCKICSNMFQTKEEILYHLKIHAGSRTVKDPTEKKFTCEHCDRKFFTRKDVRRHLVVHTGMRDFLCQFCPQTFGRKDHLVRHIKKSHSRNIKTKNIETAIKKETSETVVHPSELETSSPIKSECMESSSSSQFDNPELVYILDSSDLPLLDQSFLPDNSDQQLQDLGMNITKIFEEIDNLGSTTSTVDIIENPAEILPQNISDVVDINLLEESEETKVPLPGFSQTFQSPPPAPKSP